MAIVLPQRQVGPFGGPAGATRNAVGMIMQGVMENMERKKRERQNQELASMFAGQNELGSSFVGPPRQEQMGQQPMDMQQ